MEEKAPVQKDKLSAIKGTINRTKTPEGEEKPVGNEMLRQCGASASDLAEEAGRRDNSVVALFYLPPHPLPPLFLLVHAPSSVAAC